MRRARLLTASGVLALVVWAPSWSQEGAMSGAGVPDRATCAVTLAGETRCTVDAATYVGWRTFQAHCSTCHAEDAMGSSFAPDILGRIRFMDRQTFLRILQSGYAGLEREMPAWGLNRDVSRYYNELWSYLKGRASGDLPAGTLALPADPD